MNCIIIDDEQMARVIVRTLCNEIKSLNILEEFTNAIEAIKFLNENDVDLIFLDIHMPNFSGLEFAMEAFEYDFIVDYLLKPIELPRFEKAVKKAEKLQLRQTQISSIKVPSQKNDFYVNIDRRLIKIDLSSIYLIEAKGDYINIKTEEKEYVVHSTLKKIEEKLPDSLFLKVHRSYIINVKKIIDIEDNSVLIKKDVVPVSRSNRPELMKRLDLL